MDPRGPYRKIVKVDEIRETVPEGIVIKVKIILDCGHTCDVNPIFAYKVGYDSNCFHCKPKFEGCY